MNFDLINKTLTEEEEKKIKEIMEHIVQQEDYDSM
jgi:hypothetical protein